MTSAGATSAHRSHAEAEWVWHNFSHILLKFMIAMELAEVVNPQIAFPVVGVVICAVLVFAFGFKSPVQPPSFDFENEKKYRKQSRKAKVKV